MDWLTDTSVLPGDIIILSNMDCIFVTTPRSDEWSSEVGVNTCARLSSAWDANNNKLDNYCVRVANRSEDRSIVLTALNADSSVVWAPGFTLGKAPSHRTISKGCLGTLRDMNEGTIGPVNGGGYLFIPTRPLVRTIDFYNQ